MIAGYVEATERIEVEYLRQGVDLLIRTRKREQGFPFPADLIAACRERLERDRADVEAQRKRDRLAIEAGPRSGKMISFGEAVKAIRLPAKAGGE